MNTVMTLQIDSTSSDDTEKIAEHIGEQLRGHEVIELVSDLGGGKTTFVRGLVRGAGSIDKVASPSFTISRVYRAKKLQIHHYDFYRLPDAGLLTHELVDLLDEPLAVLVIEWADIVQSILPKDRVTIRIMPTGDTSRQLNFEYPTKLGYVLEGLC